MRHLPILFGAPVLLAALVVGPGSSSAAPVAPALKHATEQASPVQNAGYYRRGWRRGPHWRHRYWGGYPYWRYRSWGYPRPYYGWGWGPYRRGWGWGGGHWGGGYW
jgi:hypothetical protein